MKPAHCPGCSSWSRGCALSMAAQLHRHHGEPGDDSGTVLGWRLMHDIPDRPTDTTADALDLKGAPPCPGFAKVGRR